MAIEYGDTQFGPPKYDESSGLNPQAFYQQNLANMGANPSAPRANGNTAGLVWNGSTWVYANQGQAGSPQPQQQQMLPTAQQTSGTGQTLEQQLADHFGSMGGTPAGTVVSQTSTGGGNSALMQSLMSQASQDNSAHMAEYKKLQESILGKNGFLGQLGKTGMAQLNRGQQNAQGALSQNLVSRGLGNSTLQNSLSSGINRDFQEQKTNLQAQVGGQKSSAAMQLFGMNPSPSSSQYIDLLTRLGGSGGGGGGAGGQQTSMRV